MTHNLPSLLWCGAPGLETTLGESLMGQIYPLMTVAKHERSAFSLTTQSIASFLSLMARKSLASLYFGTEEHIGGRGKDIGKENLMAQHLRVLAAVCLIPST